MNYELFYRKIDCMYVCIAITMLQDASFRFQENLITSRSFSPQSCSKECQNFYFLFGNFLFDYANHAGPGIKKGTNCIFFELGLQKTYKIKSQINSSDFKVTHQAPCIALSRCFAFRTDRRTYGHHA